jgi:hypothetical protein
MRKLIALSLFIILFSAMNQVIIPDLTKKEDLVKLGVGRIIEKDNSIIVKIKLLEVKDYWIVYEKNESMHDMEMEGIKKIEFPDSKWGAISIVFPNNKLSDYQIQNQKP